MNTTGHKSPIKELSQFHGVVCPDLIVQRSKPQGMVAAESYSAHVVVAPSNYRVKLPAAGFGSGLKPLGSP